jgi:predicted nucleotidyltransferase
MPVRSLHSSVLKWPDRRTVDLSVRRWAAEQVSRRHDIARIGYFGSYARGDCGVGSDVDLIVVLETSAIPFEQRAAEFDCTPLPVPCDLLVYTNAEFAAALAKDRFAEVLRGEVVWVYVAS